MAQLRPSSVETETVWGKSEAKFGPTPLRRKSKNREKYREIYEFGLRIIKILPRFRRVPGKGQGNSSDSWDSCGQALGSQWFTLAFLFWRRHWQGIIRDPASHCETVPRLKCRSESPPPFSLPPERRTAVAVRFRTFSFSREHRFTKAATRSTV